VSIPISTEMARRRGSSKRLPAALRGGASPRSHPPSEDAAPVDLRKGVAREARRARWESDLVDWPSAGIATLAALLARFNPVREARDAQAGDS
jgi:hypothetical protein